MLRFLRELLEIVRPYGLRRLVGVCLLVVVQAVIQLLSIFSFVPFLSAASSMSTFRASKMGRVFIDMIGGGSDSHILITAGLISLAILVFGNVSTLVIEYARVQYAAHLEHLIRVDTIRLLLDRRYEYYLNTNSAVLIKSIMEDVDRFVQLVLLPAIDIFARGLLVLLLATSAMVLEPIVFGSAVLVVAVFVVFVILPIRRRASRTSEKLKALLHRAYFEVTQVLSGFKPILASTRREHFIDRCRSVSFALSKQYPKVPIYSAIPRAGLEILVFGGMICWVLVTLVFGASIVSILPRVGLVAIMAYRLLPALQLVLGQGMGIASSRQSMDEVLVIRREQAAHFGGRLPGGTTDTDRLTWNDALAFEDVSFTYAGAAEPAIHGANFVIRKGERVAFVGPTGSGKSTLIDLMLGLLEPSAGRILLDGRPLGTEDMDPWRRSLGYVPQDLFLLDGSIAENVAFGYGMDTLDLEQVKRSTELAHARGFIEAKDEGYWAGVGERGSHLSGGQRQRLAVARALYALPDILVLDEATSALDPQTEADVIAAIAANGSSLTIITVTHRLTTVRDYDRIYFVEHGRISASGTYNELTAGNAAFKKFVR